MPACRAGKSTTKTSSSEPKGTPPMRRVILAIVGTVTGLVLLLSFKTQGTGSLSSPPAAISDGTAGTTGTGTTGSAGSSTVTGDSASTRLGPVQVQVTRANGNV